LKIVDVCFYLSVVQDICLASLAAHNALTVLSVSFLFRSS